MRSVPLTVSVPAVLALIASLLLAGPAAAQLPEEDDAGSGRDAGSQVSGAVPVARDASYTATLVPRIVDPAATAGDLFAATGDVDLFAFDATGGEALTVTVLRQDPAEGSNCIDVLDAAGEPVGASSCGDTVSFVADTPGIYHASFGFSVVTPTTYTFTITSTPPGPEHWADASDMRPDPSGPTVVVAVADTGVNPYHEVYRRPHLTVHPCHWVAGFDDCSVPALELSIGVHDTYEAAYAADLEVWRSVEVGRWYWIPGTNIIGAVCNGQSGRSGSPPPVTPDTPCIHDEDGHGTATTSAVLSEAPEALLLVHEGNSSAGPLAYAPVAPDIQSHSWGPVAPQPVHAGDPVTGYAGMTLADPGADDPATLFFIAAGNLAPLPTIVDSSRVHPSVQVVGGGFPGELTPARATALSWTTFDFASWFCRPTAVPHSITAIRPSFCGTSFAAPTVAGTAAAALLELRRAEGWTGRSTPQQVTPAVSRDAFVEALRAAATYAPEHRFPMSSTGVDVPVGSEPFVWGHGFLDATDVGTVVSCATGGTCPTKPALARRWNQARHDARRAQTEPALGDAPGQLLAQLDPPEDDGGSGTDAPAGHLGAPGAVPVELGRVVAGQHLPRPSRLGTDGYGTAFEDDGYLVDLAPDTTYEVLVSSDVMSYLDVWVFDDLPSSSIDTTGALAGSVGQPTGRTGRFTFTTRRGGTHLLAVWSGAPAVRSYEVVVRPV